MAKKKDKYKPFSKGPSNRKMARDMRRDRRRNDMSGGPRDAARRTHGSQRRRP